ncbi:MAG: NADPH:quinone oxidoreductase family protein [Rhodoblastus sp.]
MKAIVSHTPGGPDTLVYEDVPEPSAGPSEVVISVAACGVNFPDLLFIQDLYQIKAPRPFSPGAEVAGVISQVGEGVAALRVGDRVIGRSGWGGMAEKIRLPADRCAKIPESMTFQHASAFFFTYATAYYALHTRARLKAKETTLILGASGGLGIAAIEIAKAHGARVIAAASSEEKLSFAFTKGADAGFVYPACVNDKSELKVVGKLFKEQLGKYGADVIFDPVGGVYAEQALRAIAEHGRYLVLGFTAGIPHIPLNLPLLKCCDIMGINWRTFVLSEAAASEENQRRLFELYEAGKVRPAITQTFELRDAAKAISRLADRTIMGKIVVVTPQGAAADASNRPGFAGGRLV